MATASVSVKQLDDITECPICNEVFTDPRVLPCIHTYCFKCINDWCKDKQPGDFIACPLCRREFSLPASGAIGLQKNFFIEKLLTIKQLASGEKRELSHCDVCQTASVSNAATSYCMECQEKLCDGCEHTHRHMKITRSHKIVELGEEINKDGNMWKHATTKCNEHEDEIIRIYCIECKTAICMMCYIEKHKSHDCSNIVKISDEFRRHMAADVDSLMGVNKSCQDMLEGVSKARQQLIERIDNTEKEICEKAEMLKTTIEDRKQKIICDLEVMKYFALKEVDSLSTDIESHITATRGFQKYVKEVLDKGTSCDIARVAIDLHERAQELQEFDSMKRGLDELRRVDVVFKQSNPDISSLTIGEVEFVCKSSRDDGDQRVSLGAVGSVDMPSKRDKPVQAMFPTNDTCLRRKSPRYGKRQVEGDKAQDKHSDQAVEAIKSWLKGLIADRPTDSTGAVCGMPVCKRPTHWPWLK